VQLNIIIINTGVSITKFVPYLFVLLLDDDEEYSLAETQDAEGDEDKEQEKKETQKKTISSEKDDGRRALKLDIHHQPSYLNEMINEKGRLKMF
jgi:hypothetical protein